MVLISVRSCGNPRAIAQQEGLGQLKKKSSNLIGIPTILIFNIYLVINLIKMINL
jgi:hypothetical protein